jgi:maleate cis-trans isomerase
MMGTNTSSRGVARIGVVVPVSNSNLEPDMQILRPDGVSFHFMRAGGYDVDQIPDSDQMRQFALASLDTVVEALSAVRPDMILYGCTSATLAHGAEFDRAFRAEVEAKAGVPAETAAGALVEALRAVGARRVGFSSPYVEQLNREAIAHLAQCGIETVSSAYVGENLGNYGQGEVTPERIHQLALDANDPRADAIVLSCTDMRSVEAIDGIEAAIGKPVITSNQAMVFATAVRLGLEPSSVPNVGRLMHDATIASAVNAAAEAAE